MDDFLRALIVLFAIIDPIGNLVVFALLTRQAPRRSATAVALVSTIAAMAIIALFVFGGNEVLSYLDISPESFQIAAGVLLLPPAYRLVESGEPWSAMPHEVGEASEMQLALVPLAIPLLAGPGALATAVTFADDMGRATTLAAAASVLVLTAVMFLVAKEIVRLVREPALRVAARLIGVLLTAIAVDLVVGGLQAAF